MRNVGSKSFLVIDRITVATSQAKANGARDLPRGVKTNASRGRSHSRRPCITPGVHRAQRSVRSSRNSIKPPLPFHSSFSPTYLHGTIDGILERTRPRLPGMNDKRRATQSKQRLRDAKLMRCVRLSRPSSSRVLPSGGMTLLDYEDQVAFRIRALIKALRANPLPCETSTH